MSRRSSNPQTPHPIWKEICPWSSISILTLSISCSVDFYPLTRDLNWNPELLLWRAGFVFLYNRSLPVSSFETTRMKALQVSFPRFLLGPFFRADFKLWRHCQRRFGSTWAVRSRRVVVWMRRSAALVVPFAAVQLPPQQRMQHFARMGLGRDSYAHGRTWRMLQFLFWKPKTYWTFWVP